MGDFARGRKKGALPLQTASVGRDRRALKFILARHKRKSGMMAKYLKKKLKALKRSVFGHSKDRRWPTLETAVDGSLLPAKADAEDFQSRFREIISDPLNLLIRRDVLAGCIINGMVVLHNGLRVPASGPMAYYGAFSDILVLNRGVHEPLEEFAFQELLESLGDSPTMLELGAYWGHYSMWCKLRRPNAKLVLVEPEKANLDVAMNNFAAQKFDAEFIQAFVGLQGFKVDEFMAEKGITAIDILHSDIQGFELEMLQCAQKALSCGSVYAVVLSTHTENLHRDCAQLLQSHGYQLNIDSGWAKETTSHDGFILATRPNSVLSSFIFRPLGRLDIANAQPVELANYVARVSALVNR
jgi:Methyltransferase FkbM domain